MNTNNNQSLYMFVRASERPVPKGYTGELRIYGNTDRPCGYTSYQIEDGHAGTFNNAGMNDPDVYWLEEISFPSTQEDIEAEAKELFQYNPVNMIDISPAERQAYILGVQTERARKGTDIDRIAVALADTSISYLTRLNVIAGIINFCSQIPAPITTETPETNTLEAAELDNIIMEIVNQWGNAAHGGMPRFRQLILNFANQFRSHKQVDPVKAGETRTNLGETTYN